MVKLIDADKLITNHFSDNHNIALSYANKLWIRKIINEENTVDPVHAANSCYCKECWYYTEWGECKEFGDIMKPDEFCSRGVAKNDKTY